MADEQGGAIRQSPDDLARLLGVDVAIIHEHVRAGAPVEDGKVHLIHYVAWLIRAGTGKDSSSNG
ncbi:MAG: hypothetical protein JXD22_02620 [Sedimentisphaerales bacterium]|nr:hypothetical protein [Sedimentisphaerales bacterium]